MEDRFPTSDADRDRAASMLRDHFAAGRLIAEELDERLTAALNAKTFGDLRRVLAAMALASSLGRWLLVLLAIPAWPYVATPLYASPEAPLMRLDVGPLMRLDVALGWIGQQYLLPAAFLGLFLMAARRESLRLPQLPPASR